MLPLLAKGGFYHAGQVCVSVQRIYVHESLFDRVADGLVDLAKKIKMGDPASKATEVGPLIRHENSIDFLLAFFNKDIIFLEVFFL